MLIHVEKNAAWGNATSVKLTPSVESELLQTELYGCHVTSYQFTIPCTNMLWRDYMEREDRYTCDATVWKCHPRTGSS